MADVAALDIVIGANVQQALAGLEHLSTELDQLAKGGVTSIEQINTAIKTLQATAAKTTDVGALSKINVAIEKLRGESEKLKGIGLGDGLKKIVPSSDAATQSLTNLGRVVQDAPFGFIGIANNLNPLVEGFERLIKKEGGLSGAFKSLGSSLMGAGGLGLAISVASSLLVVFGDKLLDTGEKAKDAAKAIKTVAQVTDDAAGSAQGQIAKVQALAGILTSTTSSYTNQKNAIEELHKISNSYFGTFEAGKTSYEDITKAVNEYTKALIAQAPVKALESEIGTAAAARLKALREYNKAAATATKQTVELGAKAIAANRAFAGSTKADRDLFDAATALTEASGKEADLIADLTKVTNENIAAFVKLGDTHTGTTKKIKENIRDILQTQEESDKLSRRIFESARDLSTVPIFKVIDIQNFRLALKDVKNEIAGFQIFKDKDINAELIAASDEATKHLISNREKMLEGEKQRLETAMKIAGSLENVFSSVFSSIASGGQNMVQVLVQALEQLIIKLAAAAAAALLLNLLFPGLTGVGGKALGFAGIFKSLMGFQHGGIVTGPTAALIGEAGPEVVFPLDRLREFIQPNAASVVVLETQVRGNDLYLIQSRTQQRRNRTY